MIIYFYGDKTSYLRSKNIAKCDGIFTCNSIIQEYFYIRIQFDSYSNQQAKKWSTIINDI